MRIINIALTVSFLVLITNCTFRHPEDDLFEFEELSYGIVHADGTTVAFDNTNKSLSGNTVKYSHLNIDEQTDTIIGELGLVFGIKFQLNSKKDTTFLLDRKWTFPNKVKNPNGIESESVTRSDYVQTNSKSWMYYTFEEEFEIIKGEWTLQYYYKNKEIYKKTFIII